MQQLLCVPLIYRLAITLALAGIIVALSIAPGVEKPGDSLIRWLAINASTPIQKAGHIGLYAFLALLSMWTLDFIESRSPRALLALVAVVVFGAALEWYQLQVPGRFGTVSDVLLNSLGAILGLAFALLLL